MTVEFLIYALGGGHGHARRGLLLQQHLALRGVASSVLLRPESDRYFPADFGPRHYALSLDDQGLAPLLRNPPPRLVVDTFPHGWRGEIDSRFSACFEKTYWIARYARSIQAAPPGFGRILSPYPEGMDEWGSRLVNAIPTGYLVDSSHWRLSGAGRCFAVFDPEGRCSGRLLSAFARAARMAGLKFAYRRRLFRLLDAAKLLVVGARATTRFTSCWRWQWMCASCLFGSVMTTSSGGSAYLIWASNILTNSCRGWMPPALAGSIAP